MSHDLRTPINCEIVEFMLGDAGAEVVTANDVPIIALSANAFEEDIAMAKDAGMNGHLAKPVDIRKMLTIISRLRR